MNIRWKRWAAGAVGLLAAYTVAGFWLVPLVIKNQVPKFGQNELARQATISEVRFNPYTLRLEAADLRLGEADGAPLFAIGKLAVELQWKSLVRHAWSFAEIRITAPSASLAIAADGKFNLAELLAARLPSVDQLRFANSGTEAVMMALKAARAFTGRPKIAKCEGAYHGSYDYAEVSLDPTPEAWGGNAPVSVAYAKGTPENVLTDVVTIPFNDAAAAVSLIREHGPELACVLVDPMPNRAGHGLSIGIAPRALSNSARVAPSAGFAVGPTGRVSANLPSSGMQTSSQTSQLALAASFSALPARSAGGVTFTSSSTSSWKP